LPGRSQPHPSREKRRAQKKPRKPTVNRVSYSKRNGWRSYQALATSLYPSYSHTLLHNNNITTFTLSSPPFLIQTPRSLAILSTTNRRKPTQNETPLPHPDQLLNINQIFSKPQIPAPNGCAYLPTYLPTKNTTTHPQKMEGEDKVIKALQETTAEPARQVQVYIRVQPIGRGPHPFDPILLAR